MVVVNSHSCILWHFCYLVLSWLHIIHNAYLHLRLVRVELWVVFCAMAIYSVWDGICAQCIGTQTHMLFIIHYANRKTIRSRHYLPHCLLCLFISPAWQVPTIPDHTQIYTNTEWQIPLERLLLGFHHALWDSMHWTKKIRRTLASAPANAWCIWNSHSIHFIAFIV